MLDVGRTAGGWLVSGPGGSSSLALFRRGTAGGEEGGGKYSCRVGVPLRGVDVVVVLIVLLTPGAGVTTMSPAVLRRELGTG